MPEDARPADASDDDLLARLRRDPSRALPALLERYETRLLRHAAAVVGSAGAQDVVQESFLRLLACDTPIENLAGWLHRVTHNLAIDHARKESRLRKLHHAAAPRTEPLAPSPHEDLDRRESQALLLDEIERLTPNERVVLMLKVKEGRSYREIAELTGLTSGNVGWLIHQGLQKVSARLRSRARNGVAS